TLESELVTLRGYGRDVEVLETDTGVCAGGKFLSTTLRSNSAVDDGEADSSQEGTSQPLPEEDAYRSHLVRMNALVDSIVAGLDDMSAVISEAKGAQERLYGAFSK
ncbi:unnamed protein product, partial [Symbiodinium microadriaticum]